MNKLNSQTCMVSCMLLQLCSVQETHSPELLRAVFGKDFNKRPEKGASSSQAQAPNSH